MIIAIDGPSGVGKSSVSREVAACLGFSCLDTGAMYRSITLLCYEEGIDLDNNEALESLLLSCTIRFEQAKEPLGSKRILINDHNVTDSIRTSFIDQRVSAISALPVVRLAMVRLQQEIGKQGNYVVEGRDIGTVVFPNAEVKIFLIATAEERARRRLKQNIERGHGSTSFDEILIDLQKRDEKDSSRGMSPLKQADDALVVDSTAMQKSEVVSLICEKAKPFLA